MDTRHDITARKHGGNAQSIAANPSAHSKAAMRQRIQSELRQRGRFGATTDELAICFNVPPNEISGRTAEMKRDGMVIENGNKRPTRRGKNAAVLVLPEFA